MGSLLAKVLSLSCFEFVFFYTRLLYILLCNVDRMASICTDEGHRPRSMRESKMLWRCEVVLQDLETHDIWKRWTDGQTVIRTDGHTDRRSEGQAFRRRDGKTV